MKRRTFLASVLAVASLPRSMAAQTAPKAVRIGWLTAQQASSLTPYLEAMRTALAELGYVEGRNLAIEFRYGDDDIERVPALASELVRLPVDLIVAQGAAAFEVHKLALPIPVVFSMVAAARVCEKVGLVLVPAGYGLESITVPAHRPARFVPANQRS